jgi:hypothetical protein
MGAYCTLLDVRRHPASLGEIMEVRCLSPYYDGVLFGDRKEIAYIPHKGCLLEIVAVGDTTHREANRLLPGQVIRYTPSSPTPGARPRPGRCAPLGKRWRGTAPPSSRPRPMRRRSRPS